MSAPYVFEFTIHRLPKMPNELLGAPLFVVIGERKTCHRQVAAAIRCQWPKVPLARARLTCIRRSSVRPDDDGLSGSFKHVIDGLVKLRIIVDDSKKHVERVYDWEKASPGKGSITVKIEELREE